MVEISRPISENKRLVSFHFGLRSAEVDTDPRTVDVARKAKSPRQIRQAKLPSDQRDIALAMHFRKRQLKRQESDSIVAMVASDFLGSKATRAAVRAVRRQSGDSAFPDAAGESVRSRFLRFLRPRGSR